MILSKQFGLAFIHVPKTAGSSISAAIGDCDPKAVTRLDGLPKTKHVTAMQLRDVYPNFKDVFSFAIVRDPFSRFCSLYRFLQARPKHAELMRSAGSLEAFAELFEAPSWVDALHSAKPQSDFVTDSSGAVIVSSVFRYEALDDAIAEVSCRLHTRLALPYKKVTREGGVDPRIPSVERILRKRFERDYQLFGYG